MTLRYKEGGIALISVLLIFAILSWVMSFFIAQTRHQLQMMELIQQRILAEIEADSKVEELIYLHLTESYKDNDAYGQWNYYGKEVRFSDELTFTFQDTQGKLNINNLNKGVLAKLLNNLELSSLEAQSFIDCIDDWEDADSLKRLNGGERDHYVSNSNLTLPRNDKIQSLSELTLICNFPKHIEKELYDNIILDGEAGFSPLFASPELILASQLDEQRQEAMLELRNQSKFERIDNLFNHSDGEIGATNYSLSDIIELELKLTKGGAVAYRNVVFSYNLRYKPRPILQYWHWAE